MKGLKLASRFLILFALLVCFGESDALAVSHSVSFSAADLTFGQEREFQRVSLAGCRLMGEIGRPQLPVKYLHLIIPQDMDVDSVVITYQASVQIQGSHYVFPAQPPVPYDDPPNTYPFAEPDSLIYNSTESFPGKLVQLVRHDFFDGCNRIATVALYPVQYQPAESTLTLYTGFGLELSFKPSTAGGIQPRFRAAHLQRIYDRSLTAIVANPEDIPSYGCGPQTLGGGGGIPAPEEPPFYPYVIVTHDSLKNYFETYESWMYRKGIKCGVVTVSEIRSYYTLGDTRSGINDVAGSIRQYLKNGWNNGTVYALLAGVGKGPFPSPAEDIVPVRVGAKDDDPPEFDENDDETYEYWIPADLYYSEFGGNWNVDGNEPYGPAYGEPTEDSVEYAPEIFVGRLPCVNGKDIKNWIEKVMHHEIVPGDSDFTYLTRHLCGEADEPQQDRECENAVQPRFTAHGWSTSLLKESVGSPSGAQYIDSMNSEYGFVDWHHHGKPTKAYVRQNPYPEAMVTTFDAYVDTATETGNGLDNLANEDKYAVLYEVNCYLAGYDIAHYNEKFSISEGFTILEKRGGPCFLGNTRLGYRYQSIDLEEYFLDALFANEITLGEAEAISKSTYTGANKHRMALSHSTIGDPQLHAWCTPCPNGIQEFLISYDYDLNQLVVRDAANNPLNGAVVCFSNEATGAWDVDTTENGVSYAGYDIDTSDVIVVTKPSFLPSIRHMGHIESNVTWNGWVVVSGDIIVDPGAKLTIKPGTRVMFEARDEMGSGQFADSCEILVLGTLVAKGTQTDSIFFGLKWKTSPSGSWGGISVGPTGVASIQYAEIKDAYTGLCLGANSTDSISHCTFQDNYYAAIIDSSDNAYIAGNRIDRDPGLSLQAEYGIYIHGVNTGSDASLQSNTITHYKHGIRAVECNTKFIYNNISADVSGIHVSGSSQVNIEESELYGPFSEAYIHCDTSEINLFRNKLWGSNNNTPKGVRYDFPNGGIARENKVMDFACGVWSNYGTPPDWGKDSSEYEGTPGYNWFELMTSGAYIMNNNADDTLYAQLNWWGTADPDPNRFLGKVKYLPCLQEPPDWIPQKIVSSQPQKSFELFQNYPNPFNAVTEICFALPSDSKVNLVIYNLLGRKVRTLVNQQQPAGLISVQWDGRDDKGAEVSTGIYLYKLQAGEFTDTKKMVLLK